MKKTYIIAEAAQGFEGSPELVKRFITLAKHCGADAIKFQIFLVEELCTPGYQYYDLFKSLEIDPAVWKEMIAYAQSIGVDFMADVFGVQTLSWLKETSASGFKIHSTDVKNYELLGELKTVNQKIYLSCGGSNFEEIQKAISALGRKDLVLLSGFQAEPNQYADVELDKLSWLRENTGFETGYADHIDANDSLVVPLPAMAVLKGATVIEKHLTIDRNHLKLEDYISALNPDEFIEMVSLIRKVEKFRFTGNEFTFSEREEDYRRRTKKVTVAVREIPAGKLITREDVALKRPAKRPDHPAEISDIIGKTASVNISLHTPITAEHLK